MAVYVYYTCWEGQGEGGDGLPLSLLPPSVRARAAAAPAERRRQRWTAWALLRWGLAERYGQTALPEVVWSAAGKPSFQDPGKPFFSLSHTEGLALCALGNVPVGADAERLGSVPPGRAARLGLPPDGAGFFASWTERESRIKLRGGSALACRRPVEPAPMERYYRLNAGALYAAGVSVKGEEEIAVRQVEQSALRDRAAAAG